MMKPYSEKTDVSDFNDALLIDFFVAVARLESKNEAELFLSDLLTGKEMTILARRLRIALLLSAGFSYRDIVSIVRAGKHTIATVQHWLDSEGAGYRLVLERIAETARHVEGFNANSQWRDQTGLSKKYAQYFWPAGLISAIGTAVSSGSASKPKTKGQR